MKTCENEITYLMTLLEWLFVIEIAASADQSHSAIEVRDLMFEAFAAYHVVINLVVEELAVATFQVVIESATIIAVVVLTVDLELATRLLHSGGFVAAVESLIVVACEQSAEQSACWSYQIDSQAIAAAASSDAYQVGC